MKRTWDIFIQLRELDGTPVANSHKQVTIEVDHASRGQAIHTEIDGMLSSIERLVRRKEVGEE